MGTVCLALLVLVWLVVSFYYVVSVMLPAPGSYTSINAFDGSVLITTREAGASTQVDTLSGGVYRLPPHGPTLSWALMPTVRWMKAPDGGRMIQDTQIRLPLWLLAALLLVWPITSYLIRRRSKRGFPLAPAGDRTQKKKRTPSERGRSGTDS
jgi:hypothetical protein